LINRINICELD